MNEPAIRTEYVMAGEMVGGIKRQGDVSAGHPPLHAENGNIFLEMSSHNVCFSFLLVSADKIGGREIIALIGNKYPHLYKEADRRTGCTLPGYGIFVRGGTAAVLGAGGQGTVRYPVS